MKKLSLLITILIVLLLFSTQNKDVKAQSSYADAVVVSVLYAKNFTNPNLASYGSNVSSLTYCGDGMRRIGQQVFAPMYYGSSPWYRAAMEFWILVNPKKGSCTVDAKFINDPGHRVLTATMFHSINTTTPFVEQFTNTIGPLRGWGYAKSFDGNTYSIPVFGPKDAIYTCSVAAFPVSSAITGAIEPRMLTTNAGVFGQYQNNWWRTVWSYNRQSAITDGVNVINQLVVSNQLPQAISEASAPNISWNFSGNVGYGLISCIMLNVKPLGVQSTPGPSATPTPTLAPTPTAAPTPLPSNACSTKGTLVREYWGGINGYLVTDLTSNSRYPNSPDNRQTLSLFDSYFGYNDRLSYGERLRAYLCPPTTGNYTFYIAADDQAELNLSTDANPANSKRIARVVNWTKHNTWTSTNNPEQKSSLVSLVAGKPYYIEGLHKQGSGGYNFSVGWTKPGESSSTINVIPGANLSSVGLPGGTSSTPAPSPTPTIPPGTISGACSTMYKGSIAREYWNGITGYYVSDLTNSTAYKNDTPTGKEYKTLFEGIVKSSNNNITYDNYGERIRGYICPPSTGTYTFYISADDRAELWLSSGASSANKVRIASVPHPVSLYQWNPVKYAEQKSAAVTLQAGYPYYIEAIMKQGSGGYHLSVGWTIPGSSAVPTAPIPGIYLSRYGF